MSESQGMVIVLSGPSGVGKGTINAELRKRHSDLVNSISLTTRAPRSGEVHGREYFFTEREEFLTQRNAGGLLEWTEYVGHFYGTPRRFVEEQTQSGKTVILEIETQGGLQLKHTLPYGVFIFVAPPRFALLEQRIRGRGEVAPDVLVRRLERARVELRAIDAYEYLVINDRLEDAVAEIELILKAERLKVSRRQSLVRELNAY